MIFQKSMLKIYEFLLLNLNKRLIIEDVIKKSKVGRSAGFKSIKDLILKGIVGEEIKGRQREIFLRLDRFSLAFKKFLDSFKFKNMDEEIKLITNLFIEAAKELEIKSVLLFGSALINEKYNDIDLLIVGGVNKKKILSVRNKIENIGGRIINIHFSESVSVERFVSSLCVYGFDYCVDFIVKNKAKDSFLEALEGFDSYERNKNNFENFFVNLAFAYCYYCDLIPKTKEEAKNFLLEEYPDLNKRNAKVVMRKIGKKIFR
jgi:predicted nucleotidyltransferase